MPCHGLTKHMPKHSTFCVKAGLGFPLFPLFAWQRIENPRVGGSIPSLGTLFTLKTDRAVTEQSLWFAHRVFPFNFLGQLAARDFGVKRLGCVAGGLCRRQLIIANSVFAHTLVKLCRRHVAASQPRSAIGRGRFATNAFRTTPAQQKSNHNKTHSILHLRSLPEQGPSQ